MPQFEQLGSPFSLVMTTPALTINDLMDASFKFDPELQEHFGGGSRYPRFTIGNDNSEIKFKTSDRAVIAALVKGMECAGVTLLYKGTFTGASATPTVTQGSAEVSATISTMRVVEAVEVSNDSDKKPAEFEITLRPAIKEADGADPTITFSFAASGGE